MVRNRDDFTRAIQGAVRHFWRTRSRQAKAPSRGIETAEPGAPSRAAPTLTASRNLSVSSSWTRASATRLFIVARGSNCPDTIAPKRSGTSWSWLTAACSRPWSSRRRLVHRSGTTTTTGRGSARKRDGLLGRFSGRGLPRLTETVAGVLDAPRGCDRLHMPGLCS